MAERQTGNNTGPTGVRTAPRQGDHAPSQRVLLNRLARLYRQASNGGSPLGELHEIPGHPGVFGGPGADANNGPWYYPGTFTPGTPNGTGGILLHADTAPPGYSPAGPPGLWVLTDPAKAGLPGGAADKVSHLRQMLWTMTGGTGAMPSGFMATPDDITHAQGEVAAGRPIPTGSPGSGTTGGVQTPPGTAPGTTPPGTGTPQPTTGPFAPVGIGGAPSTSQGLFGGSSSTYVDLMKPGTPASAGAGQGQQQNAVQAGIGFQPGGSSGQSPLMDRLDQARGLMTPPAPGTAAPVAGAAPSWVGGAPRPTGPGAIPGVANYMTSGAPAPTTPTAQGLVDPTTGRPAWTGPNGEPGYGGPQPGALAFQMPDGRVAYYIPGTPPSPGNVAALTAYSQGSGTASAGTTSQTTQQDAQARLQGVLDSYGLGSLTQWAWDKIVGGESQEAILQDLRQTDQYKQRFPGMAARQAAGLPAISEGEYLSYEKSAISLMRAAGLPGGFYDQPTDLSQFIGRDVSLTELSQRVDIASNAALRAPQAVRDQLQTLYGIGAGDLTAYFLDPTRAQPLLEKRFTAAQIGGQSTTTGYGQLTATQLEGLASAGVTDATAQRGFTNLATQHELFGALPGEAGAEGFTTDTQLAAQFTGDATAQQAIERRARSRAAVFGGSDNFAGTATGASGIGSAQGA